MRGEARRGVAGQARQGGVRRGMVWPAMARLGKARQEWQGAARPSEARPGVVGLGTAGLARLGMAWFGMSRHGRRGEARDYMVKSISRPKEYAS